MNPTNQKRSVLPCLAAALLAGQLHSQSVEQAPRAPRALDQAGQPPSSGRLGLKPKKVKFLMSGYASGAYEKAEGEDSFFALAVVPIFLWKLNERLFLEAELELEAEDGESKAELEFAQLSYVINDSMILGVGKFLNPGNPFAERLHAAWINKLPSGPLGLGPQRIMPFTQLGIQLHGAVPLGARKMNYAVYLSNGPVLEDGEEAFGTLSAEDLDDSNSSKAVGARVGYFPMPELELGYAIEFSQVSDDDSAFSDADARIQSVDLSYVGDVLGGTLDVKSQWVASDVDDVTFDPGGTLFGPVSLNNKRSGGYLQAAYRFTGSQNELLSRFEGVARFDKINLPSGAPEGNDQTRLTLGLNYWTGETSVLKLAYHFDNTDAPGADSDALILQWAIGL